MKKPFPPHVHVLNALEPTVIAFFPGQDHPPGELGVHSSRPITATNTDSGTGGEDDPLILPKSIDAG